MKNAIRNRLLKELNPLIHSFSQITVDASQQKTKKIDSINFKFAPFTTSLKIPIAFYLQLQATNRKL